MKEFGIFLLFVVGLLGGGIIGWSVSTINMQEEAIAHGVARWERISVDTTNGVRNADGTVTYIQPYSFEFRWLSPNGN